MKKSIIKNKIKFNLIKKYNYNINEIIGVKEKERYILYIDKKLIRIYRGPLKSAPLLCTYIPIEDAIFYNFEVDKNIIEKVDLQSFIETKIYEEAGVDETEEYEIKFKIIDKLKDEKKVIIETVIVPITKLNKNLESIIKDTGYIDYVSFPAFSYKALYEEKILQKGNDLFVVILYDKIFLTFYSEGELVSMVTLSGGLDRVYESLTELKIKDFNYDLFKKLITKKGLSIGKYSSNELIVLETLKKAFSKIAGYLNEEIIKMKEKYDIENLDRIFITSEYGDIEDIETFFEKNLNNIKVNSFEFYEKYNLDRLPVDPFLFLSMLETHYAYKYNHQDFNFSVYLRKPTFFYRPSGILTISMIASFIILGAYPLYLFFVGLNYEYKNKNLENEISKLRNIQIKLNSQIKKLTSEDKKLMAKINKNKKEIKRIQNFITEVYKFKFAYMPKSQELVEITTLMNKNRVYAKIIDYKDKLYTIKLFSYKESAIPNLIKDLTDNGFSVDFDKIVLKNGKYNSTIRIEE